MGIKVEKLKAYYGDKEVIKGMDFKIYDKEIVSIIGPNGSGKSTLLKAMSRCLKSFSGNVFLDGENIKKLNTELVARNLAILPQIKNAPEDITVEELVSYGRYPHLGFGKKLGKKDKELVDWAIRKTGLDSFRKRIISTLSGGERQRAWVGMALAQKPKFLLLDEPTTFLDISFQLEVLELVKELNETLNISVVMVLHDLNQAARYSDRIFVINDGCLCLSGTPDEVITDRLLKDVFNVDADIYEDHVNKCPYFIPRKMVLSL